LGNLIGYYSLIQFFPDSSRLEGVNIGVVVYSSTEQRLQVQVSKNNHRIRKFFGDQDWSFIKRAKSAVVNQLRSQHFSSVEDLKAYISKRANDIQLTPPRPMRVTDIQTDTENLFARLVADDAVDRKRPAHEILKKKLLDAGVADLVRKSVTVEIPSFKKSILVPYAYQNGRFNLITPVQFDPEADLMAKTGKNAIEGQQLFKERSPLYGEMRLVVVANFGQGIENSMRELIQKIFEEHSVTLHSLENLDSLVDDIKNSFAKHLTPQAN